VETAQTRLAGADPATFLVRFSSTPGNFALSKMIEDHNGERTIVHYRIAHVPGGKYSITLDHTTQDFDSLEQLVKAPVLNLGSSCPGSKYYAQFRIKQSVTGYVNTVNP